MSAAWRSRDHKLNVESRPDTTRSEAGSEAASTSATRVFSGSSSLASAGIVYGNDSPASRTPRPGHSLEAVQRSSGNTGNDVGAPTTLPDLPSASQQPQHRQHAVGTPRTDSRGNSAAGSTLPAIHGTQPPGSGGSSVSPGAARHCTQCGTMLVPDGRFCAACGAAVLHPPDVPPQRKRGAGEGRVDSRRGSRGSGNGSQSARLGATPPKPVANVRSAPASARSAPPSSRPPPEAMHAVPAARKANEASAKITPRKEKESVEDDYDEHEWETDDDEAVEQVASQSSHTTLSSPTAKHAARKQAEANSAIGTEQAGNADEGNQRPAKQVPPITGASAAVGSRPPKKPALPVDPVLCSVAKRMCEALEADYHRRGVHSGVKRSWSKFFADIDADRSGRITLEELDAAVRGKLDAKVSRFELRVFWRHVDADNSGLATKREFVQLMYRLDLATWPEISPEEVTRAVTTLNTKAEQYHRAGGNWFKIFNAIDGDQRGKVTYDELLKCVRSPQPGLRLSEKELPENTLRGMWKLLDQDADLDVPVHKFIVFMRKHGAEHSMHKLTQYSKKKRGVQERKEEFGSAPERSSDQLRGVARLLESALQDYWKDQGVLANTHCAGGNWDRFFTEVDSDGSGRLAWGEFCSEVLGRLSKFVLKAAGSVPDAENLRPDLKALWSRMDPDGSGEVTAKEFSLSLYKLEVESWPLPTQDVLQRVVNEISKAAQHFHRAGGNWYKVFILMDADGQGEIKFDDLREVVRGKLPFLQIPSSRISTEELKAFWKGLDHNLSGTVSGKEFMQYMRRHGGEHSIHKLTSYSAKKRGVDDKGRDVAAEIAAAPDLGDDGIRGIAGRLGKALHMWLSQRGIGAGASRSSPTNPRLWGELFSCVDTDKSGRLSFVEFERAVKTVLKAGKFIDNTELKAFWKAVDADCTGEVTCAEFSGKIYRLQLETWPALDATELSRIVGIMNNAAEKWHRCSGNWYKVFSMVDADRSGDLEYDELVDLCRKKYPCLSLQPKELPDVDLQGLWRAADADRSGKLTTKEFFAFMRQHGTSMHKATSYSLAKRGHAAIDKNRPKSPPPTRSRVQLQGIAKCLDEAIVAYWAKRGVHDKVSGNWPRFFKEADSDGSGKLTFFELERVLREKMCSSKLLESSPELVVKGVERGDLYALWAAVDVDGSGEVTAEEWKVQMYRLEIEGWAGVKDMEHGKERLSKIVDVVHEAAERWHRAGGNWFKVFRMVASEHSENVEFDELRNIIRRPLPCLALTSQQLSEEDLKLWWKAMDADLSGSVTVPEFMRFMRSNGSKKHMHGKLNSERSNAASNRAASRAAQAAAELAQANAVRESHLDLLRQALKKQSDESLKKGLSDRGSPWTGYITEWNFLTIVREILHLGEDQLNDDELYSLWRSLDPNGAAGEQGIPLSCLPGFEGIPD